MSSANGRRFFEWRGMAKKPFAYSLFFSLEVDNQLGALYA